MIRRSLSATVAALVFATLAFATTPARAQVPDLVEVAAQYLPGAPLEDPRPTEAQVSSYDAAVNAPIPITDTTFLIPGASYHVDSVSFQRAPGGFVDLRAFHALDFPLLFVQLLPRDWALSVRLAPGLAGDFTAFDSGLFRFNALALATHSFSDDFQLGGGAMVTYAFGSLLPLPAAYVSWRPVSDFTIEAFLPAFVQTKATLGDRIEIGYRAEVQGNAYAVRDDRIATAWPCRAETNDDPTTAADERLARPSDCLDHVAYSVVGVGPTLSIRLFASVWWNTFAGHTLFRRFEMLNDEAERVRGGVQTLSNVWLVRSGLSWRVPMD